MKLAVTARRACKAISIKVRYQLRALYAERYTLSVILLFAEHACQRQLRRLENNTDRPHVEGTSTVQVGGGSLQGSAKKATRVASSGC